MKVSLREIRDGIINNQSPYQQQTGLFSHFMSEERKREWHFINTEHLLSIQGQSLTNIEQFVKYGVISNAQNLQKINANLSKLNYNISLGFENIANDIKQTNRLLKSSNLILQNILEALITPEMTRAKEKARLASQNIKDALSLRRDRAKILLDEAEILLQQSIEISPFDFRAHFDLGYLYSFYRKDFKNAKKSFKNAVLRSLSKDKTFAAYSLRHLADTHKKLNNYYDGLLAIQEAFEIDVNNNKIQFEYAQYLILNKKINEADNVIYNLVSENPDYFDIAITDPIIVKENDILDRLFELRKKKINDVENILLENYKIYWNSKYVHTILKNIFGRIKSKYSNIRLRDNDKYKIEYFITTEIKNKVNELTYTQLHFENTQEIKANFKEFLQKNLNALLKEKGKKVFGSVIYLGKS